MQKKVTTDHLMVGMYVLLPIAWLQHSFLKSEFFITSEDDIARIRSLGITEVVIDTEKGSDLPRPLTQESCQADPPEFWEPHTLIPPELHEAIHDKNLSPQEKAKIIYASSQALLKRLFQTPKASNIAEAKKGIAEIVDLIISDSITAKELLKITAYDYYTYTHSVNVGIFSVMLAKALFRRNGSHDMHELGAGFFLHDIGKVRISRAIINKPGKLTEEEMAVMKTHPFEGYKILKETKQLTEECRVIVMQHHEREDGSGYPWGLKGSQIHIYGRICCIADVYDALTAERSYKKSLDPFPALTHMKETMLNHFHRDIFEKFVLLFS